MYKQYLETTYPLIDHFRVLAPGSFKHCQNVMNLCESVGKELDLNVELLKVASLYHDIGKTNNPNFFAENQDGKNPHDGLPPEVSYQIITRHVGDSVILLVQHDFPIEVIKLVSEHHGDTVLKPFFIKSKAADDSHFRYKTNKPGSTESLILMIVDCIEATAKALYNKGKLNNKKAKRGLVESTLLRLEVDEQLDKMTIGIRRKIKKILVNEIDSMYHDRPEYEDEVQDVNIPDKIVVDTDA